MRGERMTMLNLQTAAVIIMLMHISNILKQILEKL